MSPSRAQHPFHLLNTYDSQQDLSDTPFNSPSYPSFRDQRNLVASPYGESKSRRPAMTDVSSTIHRPAGAKPSGLNDARRDIHDDIRAHSRRDSAGKVFCRGSALDVSNRRACQGPPSHRPTYQILMQHRLPITIPTPTSQLADQMPVSLHRCGCLPLHPRRSPACIRMPLLRRRDILHLLEWLNPLPYLRSRGYQVGGTTTTTHPGPQKRVPAQIPPCSVTSSPTTSSLNMTARARFRPLSYLVHPTCSHQRCDASMEDVRPYQSQLAART